MPLVRIDPPRVPGGAFRRFVGGVRDLVASPAAFALGTVIDARTKPTGNKQFVPFEFDTETLDVTMLNPNTITDRGHPSFLAQSLLQAQYRTSRTIEQYLENTLRTGVVDSRLPSTYREAAAAALAARPPPGATPTWTEETTPMAGTFIPPGGMAGFLQMTPASKIALTGRSRSTTGTKRRKKRSKTTSRKRKTGKTSSRRKSKSAGTTSRKKSRRGSRLVKGSAAAKRYMASIRKKRR